MTHLHFMLLQPLAVLEHTVYDGVAFDYAYKGTPLPSLLCVSRTSIDLCLPYG